MSKAFGTHPFPKVPLGDIASRFYQGINTVADKIKYAPNGFPIIQAKHITGKYLDLKNSRYMTAEDYENYKNKYRPAKGDILLTNIGTIGKSCIVKQEIDFLIAWNVFLISTTKNAHSIYINYLLEQLDQCNYYDDLVTGNATKFINKTTLGAIELPLPPLPEQQKIAKILTSVDEVIEKTQAQIDKLKDLKTGMMQELLTKGIGHTEFKDSPVGRIPVGWEVKPLLQVCTSKYAIVDGPFGSNLKTEHYRLEGIPVFQSGFVTSNKFKNKKYVYVDQSKYEEQIRSSAGPHDILMAKIGMNAGACAIIPSDHPIGILAGNSLKITVDKNSVLNDYIVGLIHFMQDTGEIRRLLTETAQPAISITTLKKMNIPIPPLEEQQNIVNLLAAIDRKVDLTIKKLEAQQKLKKALMQDLLTGKVRVKIDKETAIN